ncbi:hypothetical protein WMY93_005852 [Mugilogobius chulae]|uniref:Reverse transcriptase domain-containing protein n=1 Tax=Mugilogobius chulae TaxID=88201 RepID=A0AAW0PKW3_9GOBI
MAARTDAAARSSYYFCTLLVQRRTFTTERRLSAVSGVSDPPGDRETTFGTPAAADRRRKRCERRQKRGKRGGVWARLKASPFKPPLPTIFLSNARSIRHKLDEIRLQIATRRTLNHCSCLIFSETWLDNSIPDAAIELAGRTAYRADRTAESGKKTGGGLCIYINNSWCTNVAVMDSLCSPEAELLLLKCRPFYLPREFAVVYICAVYIPPDANAKLALAQVSSSINNSLVAHPDSVFIAAGDFNHADLKSVLHKFHRNVKCATRGDRTLDQVYTNVAGAYRAQAYPHLGLSDHLSLLLHPRYTPKIKSAGITVKTVRTWPEDAVPMLQDCFHHTDWDVFKEQNTDKRVVLDNYTSTVLDYICFCVDNVTCWRQFRVFPNTPPWMTQEVKQLIRARDTAFHSGDQEAYSAARADLRRGINTAKRHYRRRIEARFETTTNPRQVWEGIRAITDYKRRSPPSSADSPTLAEDLNLFYARFDRDNTDPVLPPLPTTGLAPVLSVHEVRRVFCSINTRKAAGPDGVLGRVLKDCAAELADVFTSIFNISLSCSLVPACFKAATIVPLPKQPNVTCLNDFRPVALTSIPAKCLERLVIKHIKAALPLSLDPHQFAYRENRSTEDAIATVLHTLLEHLEHKNTYARLLFVDYSSAFNTIRPYKLRPKLHQLGLNTTLCNWIFADDTTVLGLITNNDEANYRREVQHLESWCHNNNLVLNTKKTKEIVVDFRRRGHTDHQPLFIGKDVVERVQSFKFLGVTVTEDLSWGDHISKAVGKAQQRLYYLRKLKSAHISRPLMDREREKNSSRPPLQKYVRQWSLLKLQHISAISSSPPRQQVVRDERRPYCPDRAFSITHYYRIRIHSR